MSQKRTNPAWVLKTDWTVGIETKSSPVINRKRSLPGFLWLWKAWKCHEILINYLKVWKSFEMQENCLKFWESCGNLLQSDVVYFSLVVKKIIILFTSCCYGLFHYSWKLSVRCQEEGQKNFHLALGKASKSHEKFIPEKVQVPCFSF